MAKPRRSTADAFYDVFSDMPLSEQVIALRICQELHRQAIKLARADVRKTDAVASAARGSGHMFDGSEHCLKCGSFSGAGDCPGSQGSLLDDPDTESGNGGSKPQ